MVDWRNVDTTTHQHHVVAHVIGAKVLGYFVYDETAYFLLDIGFIWHVYLNGEMGLIPHGMAIQELEIAENARSEIRSDIDALLKFGGTPQLRQLTAAVEQFEINRVELLEFAQKKRIEISGESSSIVFEADAGTGEVAIMGGEENAETELTGAVQAEMDFLRTQMKEQLGREPSDEELNEWLREHTESY
ncbi:MAG: hypothetical protein ABR555_17350 [Pyrinomonadaceae bacterium]